VLRASCFTLSDALSVIRSTSLRLMTLKRAIPFNEGYSGHPVEVQANHC
jgi:hypothetical protein